MSDSQPNKKCQNCSHWKSPMGMSREAAWKGECRFDPPVVAYAQTGSTYQSESREPGALAREVKHFDFVTKWPETLAEDWCHQFEPVF